MSTDRNEDKPRTVERPTEAELRVLPRWARVAFAARCARRVQPLFRFLFPEATVKHINVLDNVVTLAERSAANATEANIAAVTAAKSAVRAATAAAIDCAFDSTATPNWTANSACTCSAVTDAAVTAAHAAADANNATYIALAVDGATRASDNASFLASCTGDAQSRYLEKFEDARKAIWRDFALLKDEAAREKWTDDTPVEPEVFGPLWTEEATLRNADQQAGKRLCEKPSQGCELVLEVDLPAGVSEQEVREMAVELADQADDLHRILGGKGLKVVRLEIEDLSRVREGVPA